MWKMWRMSRTLCFMEAIGILLLAGVSLLPSSTRAAGQASAMAVDCDRQCLAGFVDQYLNALVAHDPSQLPVTKLVKFTENGQKLELGDGLWISVTGKGTYRFFVDDTAAAQR